MPRPLNLPNMTDAITDEQYAALLKVAFAPVAERGAA